MKMRTGLVAGAAIGYYLGAKAGRQRYEQMSRVLGRAARSGAMRSATTKLRAAADLGKERVKDLIGTDELEEAGSRIVRIDTRRAGRLPHPSSPLPLHAVVGDPDPQRRYW